MDAEIYSFDPNTGYVPLNYTQISEMLENISAVLQHSQVTRNATEKSDGKKDWTEDGDAFNYHSPKWRGGVNLLNM